MDTELPLIASIEEQNRRLDEGKSTNNVLSPGCFEHQIRYFKVGKKFRKKILVRESGFHFRTPE